MSAKDHLTGFADDVSDLFSSAGKKNHIAMPLLSALKFSTAATLLLVSQSIAQNPERCIVRAEQGVTLEREATDFLGIGTEIGIAYEGFLTIGGVIVGSPTGDFTFTAGPYDPSNQRLYIWGYFKNGWVNLETKEKNVLRPYLYSPKHDIEDVVPVLRSDVLGVQFYSEWTSPNWLTGRQKYRMFILSEDGMRRVEALEKEHLYYVGDDVLTGLAGFAPEGRLSEGLVWFDGVSVVRQPGDLQTPSRFCDAIEY